MSQDSIADSQVSYGNLKENGYSQVSSVTHVQGANYVDPITGVVKDDLHSKLDPSVYTFKTIPGKVYLISGTRMADFGMLAGWYDSNDNLIERIDVCNGMRRSYDMLPMVAPDNARFIKIQGTNIGAALLYQGDYSLSNPLGFYGEVTEKKRDDEKETDLHTKSLEIFWKRIAQLQDISWTPIKVIPNNQGVFRQNIQVTGLPYSSVKELQKFLGMDVSVYTFMTALNDSCSLLYTQNVANGNQSYLGKEYDGINCACYYGTVCNSFTAYCYGLKHNYVTDNFKNCEVPYFKIKENQSISQLNVGDMWWNQGHVALVSNLWKDANDNLKLIEISESAGTHIHATVYTPWQLQKRILKNKAIFYEYTKFDEIAKENISDEMGAFEGFKKLEICTWFGDKAAIADWDEVKLNFTKGDYESIIITKDGVLIDSIDLSISPKETNVLESQERNDNPNIQNQVGFTHKGAGIYNAYLSDGRHLSFPTTFEIIETSLFNLEDSPQGTIVRFSSGNGNPEVVFWVNAAGSQLSVPHIITEKELAQGFAIIEKKPKDYAQIKIIFKGKFGRVINNPWSF